MVKMKNMKIVIFGTGKIYQRLKETIRSDVEVLAFIDNDESKQGRIIDNKVIYHPSELSGLEYDYVALFCRSDKEMKRQLLELGVSYNSILGYDRLYRVLESEPGIIDGTIQNRGKKVLIFSHALIFSGAQNVLYKAIQILLINGCSIIVVSNIDGELRQKLQGLGVAVVLCKDYGSDNEIMRRIISWCDLILINTLWLQYVVEELYCYDKKIIWWLHESGALHKYDLIGMDYILNKENVEMYAVSQKVKDYISTFYDAEDKIRILSFGLPEYCCEEITGEDKMRFMQIGPFSDIKGQDLLVKAIDGLEHVYKTKIELNLIGGGEVDEDIQCLIKRNPCIHVLGRIANENIPDYYAKTDVVICCSREESMSVVVMEGFMNGIPAIVSDVTGITEYMEDGREGLIFQSENVEELQQKIRYMVDHQDRIVEMGRNARENYLKNFTMEQFEKNLLRVFEV